jgi:hypothetical protein
MNSIQTFEMLLNKIFGGMVNLLRSGCIIVVQYDEPTLTFFQKISLVSG